MVAFHNTQQSNPSRAAGGGNSSAFVELRMGASTMVRRALPSFPTDAYDEGAAIHRRERHHRSPVDKIGSRARPGWLWEARGAARV